MLPIIASLRANAGKWVLAAGFLASLPLCLTPIDDPDLPWHLSAGRYIWEQKAIPRQDFLSWTKAGAPWTDFEWGTHLVYYGLTSLGGEPALWTLKLGAFTAVMALFVLLTRLWALPAVWAGLALPPMILCFVPYLDIRPELFTFNLCLLQMIVLEARRLGRPIPAGPKLLLLHAALYAVWANMHAGFVMGLGLCALYFCGEWAEQAAREPRAWRAPDWRALAPWAGLGLAAFAGTFATPFGFRLYSVHWTHWEQKDILPAFIMEWSSPNFSNPYQRPYWLLLAFCFACFLIAWHRRRAVPYAHWFVLLGLGALASRSYRLTVYVPLLLFPLALRTLYEVRSFFPGKAAGGAVWAALAYLALGFAGRPMLQAETIFNPGERRFSPEIASEFLRREREVLAPLKMYNPYNWGGYLGYALHPDYKVFVDGRYIFGDYLPMMHYAERNPAAWREFLNERKCDLVVTETYGRQMYRQIQRGWDTWRPFQAYALGKEDWALVHWDSLAMVFVRRSAVPEKWLAGREFRFLRPADMQFMSLAVITGKWRLEDIEAEVERYGRQVGDARELRSLREGLEHLKTEAARSAGGRT